MMVQSFQRNIKYCFGLGRIKQIFYPWPYSPPALATASTTKLNNHFIESVKQLCNAAVSPQTLQQLWPTTIEIITQQCF